MTQLFLIGIGTGNPDHLTGEARRVMAEADLFLVPHKGAGKSDLADLRTQIIDDVRSDAPVALFDMPVRLGYPSNLVGSESAAFHPGCATALGLLRYAQRMRSDPKGSARKGFFAARSGRRERMTNWLLEKIQ